VEAILVISLTVYAERQREQPSDVKSLTSAKPEVISLSLFQVLRIVAVVNELNAKNGAV